VTANLSLTSVHFQRNNVIGDSVVFPKSDTGADIITAFGVPRNVSKDVSFSSSLLFQVASKCSTRRLVPIAREADICCPAVDAGRDGRIGRNRLVSQERATGAYRHWQAGSVGADCDSNSLLA
jgi:hypothetical protein